MDKENYKVNKIVVSNKLLCGKEDFKCFINYKDAKKMRPLCNNIYIYI